MKSYPVILYITPWAPLPANYGGALRSNAVWRALSSIGQVYPVVIGKRPSMTNRKLLYSNSIKVFPSRIEGTFAKLGRYSKCLVTGEDLFSSKCISIKRLNQLKELAQRLNPDLVVVGDVHLSCLLPFFKCLGKRVIVDAHNAESKLLNRMRNSARGVKQWCQYALMEYTTSTVERRYLHFADQIWIPSDADQQYYSHKFNLTNILVVPNVVDLALYEDSLYEEIEPNSMVFTGFYQYFPNEDAALRLIKYSKKLSCEGIDHKLYLVGRSPTEKMYRQANNESQIVITGEVPDTKPYLARAAFFAAPLASGGGTKLKILEAMAMSKMVITTPVGDEGIYLNELSAGLVVDLDQFYEQLKYVILQGFPPEIKKWRANADSEFSLSSLVTLLEKNIL